MKLAVAVISLSVACCALPAAAQSILQLGGGAMSVTIPRGEPKKLEWDGEERGVLRQLVAELFKPFLKANDTLTEAKVDEFMNAFTGGETWQVMDAKTGQSFAATTFRLPASLTPPPRPLACSARIRNGIESNGMAIKCRDVAADGVSGIETRATTSDLAVSATRGFVVDGRFYELQYHRLGSDLMKAMHLAGPTSDDEAAFMTSFHIKLPVAKPQTQ